jgi:hypothetical protein
VGGDVGWNLLLVLPLFAGAGVGSVLIVWVLADVRIGCGEGEKKLKSVDIIRNTTFRLDTLGDGSNLKSEDASAL